jgi:hypothetical protein
MRCNDCGRPAFYAYDDEAYHHATEAERGCFLIRAEHAPDEHRHPLVGIPAGMAIVEPTLVGVGCHECGEIFVAKPRPESFEEQVHHAECLYGDHYVTVHSPDHETAHAQECEIEPAHSFTECQGYRP